MHNQYNKQLKTSHFAFQGKFWSSILERTKRRWFLLWTKATKYTNMNLVNFVTKYYHHNYLLLFIARCQIKNLSKSLSWREWKIRLFLLLNFFGRSQSLVRQVYFYRFLNLICYVCEKYLSDWCNCISRSFLWVSVL